MVIRGACAAETTLLGPTTANDNPVVLAALGAQFEVRDVRLGPSSRPGVIAQDDGTSLRLEGVEIDGPVFVGMAVVSGASLEASRLSIESPGDLWTIDRVNRPKQRHRLFRERVEQIGAGINTAFIE